MVTIKDIAKHAGVAPITVSRVVSNSGYVSQETRLRVEAAIKELNYVPNLVARNLRSRQSDVLALVLPDITNSFWTSIARGAEDEAWAHGYGVFICNTDNDVQKEESYIDSLIRRRVEGILFVPTPHAESEEQLRRLRQRDLKFVVVHRPLVDFTADVVRTDSEGAARTLTTELIRLGRTRVGYVGLPLSDPSSAARRRGYETSLRRAGLPIRPELVRTGEREPDVGYRLVRELLRRSDESRPDSILLANSRIALGGLRAIEEAGLRIPDDVAVAAFHDINTMDGYAPRLIRAVQPGYKMGQLATRRLLEMKRQEPGQFKEIILEPEIHLLPQPQRASPDEEITGRLAPSAG